METRESEERAERVRLGRELQNCVLFELRSSLYARVSTRIPTKFMQGLGLSYRSGWTRAGV